MKAAVIDRFGSATQLHVRDVAEPEPAPGQLLIQVHASSVNPIDWKIRDGLMAARYPAEFPMILGFDAAGVVAQVGPGVEGYAEGDEVWVRSDNGPGQCYAEYLAVNSGVVAAKPKSINFLEAASMPLAGLTCLAGLRDLAELKAGQRVLLVGASGGVGVYATQIAKLMGAEVTGVCSGKNAALAQRLGADCIIDYTREQVFSDDIKYDVIYDLVGALSLDAAQRALTEKGVYLTLVPVPGVDFFVPGQTQRETGKGYFVTWIPRAADLDVLNVWVTDGRLKPVIDSEFSLGEIREAHRRSETLRAVGKIGIHIRQ